MKIVIERPLKEIDYMSDKFEILGSGIINQIPWLIIYTGNHPCAYVCIQKQFEWEVELLAEYLPLDISFKINEGSPLNKDFFITDEFDLDKSENYLWFGWDYCHLFDMHHSAIGRWTTTIDTLKVHSSREIFTVIQKIINKISQVRKDDIASEITTNGKISGIDKILLYRTGVYRDIDYAISHDDINFYLRIEYLDLSPEQLNAVTDQFDISINKSANIKVFEMTRSINIPFDYVMKDVYRFIDIIKLLEKDE